MKYRSDIDGMRAIAVMAVVLSHSNIRVSRGYLIAPGGFVGVDVFFVLSGYLITKIIATEMIAGTFTFAAFWERRVRRILPALIAVAMSIVIVGWVTMIPEAYQSLGKSLVGLSLLAANIHFYLESGYFDEASDQKPLLHIWSLAVEEQFYLLLPFLLVCLLQPRFRRNAMSVLATLAIGSFGFSVWRIGTDPDGVFYLLPSRAWELLAGSLMAFAPILHVRRWVWETAALLGLFSILIPCFVYDNKTAFPGLAALPPVLGTAILIGTGLDHARLPLVNRLLAWRPVVFIGKISYSLYLWHWPIFVFARQQSFAPLSRSLSIVLIGVSLLFAVISWRFVEEPFRSRRICRTRSRLASFFAAIHSLLLLVGILIVHNGGFPQRLPAAAHQMVPSGHDDEPPRIELYERDIPDRLVHLGDLGVPAEVLIWGDSHAMHLVPGAEVACRELGSAAVVATHSNTAPAVGYFLSKHRGLTEQEALGLNEAVLKYASSGQIRAVVLGGQWENYLGASNFPDAMVRTVDALNSAGVSVYFVRDIPSYPGNVRRQLVRDAWSGTNSSYLAISQSDLAARNRTLETLIAALEKRGVMILDPVAALQSRSGYTAFLPYDSGGAYYWDSNHLSVYGSSALSTMLIPVFQRDHDSRTIQKD